jgi:cytochrome P450
MWTEVLPEQLADIPIDQIATSAAPDRWHPALRQAGTHCRDGSWVVAGSRDVAAALASPALTVAAVPGQNGPGADGPAARLLASMARFSDGPDHRRRRELITSLLPPVPRVARTAAVRTNDYLSRRNAAFDVMPLARQLPAEVLAAALGLAQADAARAATLTGMLCDAVTPSLLPREGTAAIGDGAASQLTALMAGRWGQDDERVTAAVSILFQARDATAALIGTAVLAGGRGGGDQSGRAPGSGLSGAQRVEHALRHEAPVQCTRRTALAEVQIGDAKIPAGAPVWIFVATAERGSGIPATFGSGPHGCPGAAHASAIARQVVTVLAAEGWRPVAGQRIDLEPRPNLRVPARVLVTRA